MTMKPRSATRLAKRPRATAGANFSTITAATPTEHRLIAEHSSAETVRKAPVRIHAPQANRVVVTGSFNGWTSAGVALTANDHGWWMTELELPPGRYEYRFLVDGEWANGPDADGYAANPFGSLNCVLVVS